MIRMGATLKCLAVVGLLAACGAPAAAGSPNLPAQAPGNPQVIPAAPAGRWKIIPVRLVELPAPPTREGWKIVRVDIVLENESSTYSAPLIPMKDATIFTDPTHFYPAATLRTTGSVVTNANEISFAAMLPKGYRVHGEYRGDTIVAYYIQATIPKDSQPSFIRVTGYDGDIKTDTLKPNELSNIEFPGGDSTVPVRSPNSQIEIPGKARLTVGKFSRSDAWPLTHDIISGIITIENENPLDDTRIHLNYLPIGKDGIVGAPFTVGEDCAPDWIRGPKISRGTRICMIIPSGTTGIRIIFTGDMTEVFDSGL